MDGSFVGSCIYPDLCVAWKTMFNLSPDSCSPEAVYYGIDCNCPFDIPAQLIDSTSSLQITDFSTLGGFYPIIRSGDYDVRFVAHDKDGFFGCLNVKFTLKKAV